MWPGWRDGWTAICGGSVVRRGLWQSERGVAVVEFAIVLPIFLLVVAGLINFGRVFFYWIETNHLANETVRWAVVDRNPYFGESLQQHAQQSATEEFRRDVAVCIDFPGTSFASVGIGDPVRVRVQKPFSFTPLLGLGSIQIKGSATMRVERIANGRDPSAYSDGQNIGTCT